MIEFALKSVLSGRRSLLGYCILNEFVCLPLRSGDLLLLEGLNFEAVLSCGRTEGSVRYACWFFSGVSARPIGI